MPPLNCRASGFVQSNLWSIAESDPGNSTPGAAYSGSWLGKSRLCGHPDLEPDSFANANSGRERISTGFVCELANSERAESRPIILGMRRRRNVRFRGSRKLAPPNPAKAGSSEAPGSGRCKGANRMIGVEARGLATVAQATGEGCLGNPRRIMPNPGELTATAESRQLSPTGSRAAAWQ